MTRDDVINTLNAIEIMLARIIVRTDCELVQSADPSITLALREAKNEVYHLGLFLRLTEIGK